jgi:polyphosphate kinase
VKTGFDPELSRLAYEDRLIEFCEDERIPLLERVRLLAIAGERLDTFFLTRVGRLKRLLAEGDQKRAAPVPPDQQLAAIATEANRMVRRSYRLLDELMEKLAAANVGIERLEDLDAEDRAHLQDTCGSKLSTLVKLVVVEPSQPFPHVRNLRPALFAMARRRSNGSECLVIVELPADLPRLVRLARKHRFVPLEQIIAAELPALCPDLDILAAHVFRVTRNASVEPDDDDDMWDFEEDIEQRPFQEVVRLEVEHTMPQAMRERLLRELGREEDMALAPNEQDTYTISGLVDLTGLEQLAKLDLPGLKSPPLTRRKTRLDGMLDAGSNDVLLHFPYDDYESSIGQFLQDAALHPDLESIQTTIYRTDKESDVVAALRAAKKRGAAAKVVVELKASFDERDNIELARSLEADGVEVVLSPVSLKVHAKVALVTFREGHLPRRVALIGTGNMNAVTSRSYIDLWLVTRDPDRTRELAALFDVLTGVVPAAQARFDHLLVSPFEMRRRFLDLIERETAHAAAGKPAGIRAMMNGLTDPTTMAALYRASQAGVPIELMVRGVCLLRPGAPGMSENIRIVSVAGQLLQHARIFHFANAGEAVWYIGSADWRPRNFEVRVEVIARVSQADHIAVLDQVLSETLTLPDAWTLQPDGVYVRGPNQQQASAA